MPDHDASPSSRDQRAENDETKMVQSLGTNIPSSETGPLDETREYDADTSPGIGGNTGREDDSDPVPNDLSVFQSEILEMSTKAIGRYQIERKLGAGGFGQVLLATDEDLRRRVAIKIPFKERVASPEDVNRFLDEARVIALLDHPGVVPIYDFGKYEDRCFVVCKFIEGGTLSERIKNADLALDTIVDILCSLANTLDFIHESGVIHRDIKPANILLDEHDQCYVSDFGLAIHDNSLLRRPGRVGTFSYMSPEQARGESHLVDGRSDLFSLGVIMYEMLTGKRPFVAENWQKTLELICEEEPEPLRQIDPTISKELERICSKLLSKQAASRYATAKDLHDDLQYLREHGPDLSTQRQSTHSASLSASADAPQSSDQLVGIVPRGLRSFDQEDADYFRN